MNTAITTNTTNIGDLSTLAIGDGATQENKSSLVNVANYLYTEHIGINTRLTQLEEADSNITWLGNLEPNKVFT